MKLDFQEPDYDLMRIKRIVELITKCWQFNPTYSFAQLFYEILFCRELLTLHINDDKLEKKLQLYLYLHGELNAPEFDPKAEIGD